MSFWNFLKGTKRASHKRFWREASDLLRGAAAQKEGDTYQVDVKGGGTAIVMPDDDVAFFRELGIDRFGDIASKAVEFLNTDDFESSYRCGKLLIGYAPEQAPGWLLCAMALLRHGQKHIGADKPGFLEFGDRLDVDALVSSIEYWNVALKFDPHSGSGLHGRAKSNSLLGQVKSDPEKIQLAVKDLASAYERTPNDIEVLEDLILNRILYGTLESREKRREMAEGVCDACNYPTNFCDGYALTTDEVITQQGYWRIALIGPFKPLLQLPDEQMAQAFGEIVQQQAAQNTGWLICERCSALFDFDRALAKDFALNKQEPPNAGPLNTDISIVIARLMAAKTILSNGTLLKDLLERA